MKKLSLMVAGVLLAVSAQAQYAESFETCTVGPIKGVLGWSTIGNSNYVNVASDPAIATDGTQYLVWTNTGLPTATDPNAVTRLYRSGIQKTIVNQPVIVSWDFNMADKSPKAYVSCDVILNAGAQTMTRVDFQGNMTFGYYNGGTYVQSGVQYLTNNWYRIVVTGHAATETYDLNIFDLTAGTNNVLSLSGLTNYKRSAGVAVTKLYAIQWNAGNNATARPSTMYLDNISVADAP